MPTPPDRPTTPPDRLPAGRHGLDPEFVAANQRDRLTDAVAAVVSMTGYHRMTIDDIVGRAGVSRRSFYDNFETKEEAFLASYDREIPRLRAAIQAGADAGDGFADATYRALGAAFDFVLAEPAAATVCLVEILSIGPAGIERRNQNIDRFVSLLEGLAATAPERMPLLPPLTTRTVVGGISEVVYNRLVQGKTAELPGILPDLLYSVLMPYVGHEAALAQVSEIAERQTDRV